MSDDTLEITKEEEEDATMQTTAKEEENEMVVEQNEGEAKEETEEVEDDGEKKKKKKKSKKHKKEKKKKKSKKHKHEKKTKKHKREKRKHSHSHSSITTKTTKTKKQKEEKEDDDEEEYDLLEDKKHAKKLPKIKYGPDTREWKILSRYVLCRLEKHWERSEIRTIRSDKLKNQYVVLLKGTNSTFCSNPRAYRDPHPCHSVKFVALRQNWTIAQECFNCDFNVINYLASVDEKSCEEWRGNEIKFEAIDAVVLFPKKSLLAAAEKQKELKLLEEKAEDDDEKPPQKKHRRKQTKLTSAKKTMFKQKTAAQTALEQRQWQELLKATPGSKEYWERLGDITSHQAKQGILKRPELELPPSLELKDPSPDEIAALLLSRKSRSTP
jgi:hypothetical protein